MNQKSPFPSRPHSLPPRMAGLSLIELMISITIGLMILSAVAVVFVNTSAARNEIERTSRQIENGRYAIELISDDLRLAGFYGELNIGSVTVPGALPADQCSLDTDNWNAWIPLHVQGFDNGTGFSQTTCALTNHKANTDILLVRRTRTCYAGTGTPTASYCGDTVSNTTPYMQVSLCASEVTGHKFGVANRGSVFSADTDFDRKKKDCSTAADKREYYVRIYYISTENGRGQNIPTLKRIELTSTGWTTVSLVEGIEEFNVAYGLDTNNDGAPDSYSASPAAIGDWLNVVSVQFHVLARNLETSPDYTDSKTYTLGIDAANAPVTVTPGGGYRRHVYSSLVRLINPSGRKDVP